LASTPVHETTRTVAAELPEPPGSQPPSRPRLKKLRFALVLLGLAVLAFVSWIFGIMMAVAQDLPDLENRAQFARAENSVIYDIDHERIATVTNNQGRLLVGSEDIAPTVREAVVAIEDQRFYEHRGVDWIGIGRAVYQDVLSGSAEQGASTITQQFVKNALAAQEERTIFQKLREAALAYHLERQWSKDKILTEYLNSIYFGEGAYGIEAAARTYFGWNHQGCGEQGQSTCASQLFPWEAALLAGLISSPTAYSPRVDREAATARRNLVLERMVEEGFITDDLYAEYSQRPVPAPSQIRSPEEDSRAPYFTSWLRQQLVDRYGAGEAFGGGLEITSTLDLDLQQAAEQIVASRLAAIEPTAAVVVLDNETAAVRAMVGGPDFERAPFNLATNGHRQPGSAFKPFTLVTALENGVSTDRTFASEPKTFPFIAEETGTRENFVVHNYEDNYLGVASLDTATTYSDNSVYAELGMELGTERIADTAQAMGIQTPVSTNPAMILGGLQEGVTPLEMAHAYETLATGGLRISGTMAASSGGPVGIDRVEDEDGEVVEDNTGASGDNKVVAKQVIDPTAAETAVDVLESVVASGTGTNAVTGEYTWGKTGTTDDNADAWFVGATEDITVAVWVGHPDSATPMRTEFGGNPVDGGTFPALIFADIVNAYVTLEAADDAEDGDVESPSVPTTPVPAPESPTPAPEEEGEPTGGGREAPATDGGGETPAPQSEPPAPESPAPAPSGGGGATPDGGTGAPSAG
jgi:penicillin-binding protein 1A